VRPTDRRLPRYAGIESARHPAGSAMSINRSLFAQAAVLVLRLAA
jgi:hypothetical protein